MSRLKEPLDLRVFESVSDAEEDAREADRALYAGDPLPVEATPPPPPESPPRRP